MQKLTRRAILAVAGTVAAVPFARKPGAQTIHTPIVPPGVEKEVRLQPLSRLVPTEPPAPPPQAQFLDAEGASHDLSGFAGSGLVVNLWATWCVPCVAEMPALQEMAKKLAAEKILVLPLSSDRGGAEAVRKFYAAHGIDALPVWLDPKGEAARAWGARGLPTTLIIDRQGREKGRVEGAVDWASDASLAEIRKLVGQS
jgi:thiol-disulfide isomerase/thioredoxin